MRWARAAGVGAIFFCGAVQAEPSAAANGAAVLSSDRSPSAQSTQVGQVLSGTTFRVLRSWRVNLSGHSIIYNRVEAPLVPSQPLIPAALPTTAQPNLPEPSKEKAQRTVSLSATVYDRRITDLNWFHGTKQIRVFSNIDFIYFATLGNIETSDVDYELVFGLGTASSDSDSVDTGTLGWLAQARLQLPNLTLSPAASASYLIADGAVADDPDGFAVLDTIHAYFNAHRTELIQSYRKQAAEAAAQQFQLRLHPPVVKDTVINFWPKRGSIHLNGGN